MLSMPKNFKGETLADFCADYYKAPHRNLYSWHIKCGNNKGIIIAPYNLSENPYKRASQYILTDFIKTLDDY
ncbi:hypothetical protein AYI70_g190 [Smittium culicis]|uniref:Uncharacterized protein n=1 Tax=Smittium culicis TaxID=133412 RepID=A0A1R1YHL1_9FUNG|nr:hypothetical protein AYI70_g190 [Smittium culicis]